MKKLNMKYDGKRGNMHIFKRGNAAYYFSDEDLIAITRVAIKVCLKKDN